MESSINTKSSEDPHNPKPEIDDNDKNEYDYTQCL